MDMDVFKGCLPALMTPCRADGSPAFDELAAKGRELVERGMNGVVYCGSMGDWPLIGDTARQEGVERLVAEGLPVVVGTGAVSPGSAVLHASHARDVGAKGLMVIPRVLSRGSSAAAQRDHFSMVLEAAGGLPAVIYNSPYYGFETRADLFFELRAAHPNLVGYKEFGGAAALSYAAEHITSGDDELALVVGVDTEVVHGIVNCGSSGVITGIGNVLPEAVLLLTRLSSLAASGNAQAYELALELDRALRPLAVFDEGPDLVLYFKYLMTLRGETAYQHHANPADTLSSSQKRFAAMHLERFDKWFAAWDGKEWGS